MKNYLLSFMLLLIFNLSIAQENNNCIDLQNIKNQNFKILIAKFECKKLPINYSSIERNVPFNEDEKLLIEKFLCFNDSCFNKYQVYEPGLILPTYKQKYILLIFNWEDNYSGYSFLCTFDFDGNRIDYIKLNGGTSYPSEKVGDLDMDEISSIIKEDYSIEVKRFISYLGENINSNYQFEGTIEEYTYIIESSGIFKKIDHKEYPRMKFDTKQEAPKGEFPRYIPIETSN